MSWLKEKTGLVEAIYAQCAAIYRIDLKNKIYQTLQQDELLSAVINETGSMTELYTVLFHSDRQDSHKRDLIYNAFFDDGIFYKDNAVGYLHLTVHGIGAGYHYCSMKLSEQEGIFILIRNDEQEIIEENEKMKMSTLKDSFLFSMIVDLGEDRCKNSNTAELSADNNGFINIPYSKWRNVIVNMFLPDDRNTFLKMTEPDYIISRLANETQFRYEIQMLNMQGVYIWVRLIFRRMKNFSRENPVILYVVEDIHEDMTRLLKQENIISAIQQENEKLATINKTKTMFISNMSHEIRTPINAVLGLNEMIIRESDDKKIQSYAYDIKNAGKMLLSIINDILDYSKIESGKMEIVASEYNVAGMISDIANMISVKAKEKELPLKLNINEALPSVLLGDEVRIRQIIINILANAVKYTETGFISLTVDFEEKEGKEIGLRVSVKDTGIGMKEEDMKNLFQEYAILDEKRNHNIEGTGLGMSIVIRLLEQMNSKLEVESTYGSGSVFSFLLPQLVVDSTPIGDISEAKRKIPVINSEEKVLKLPNVKILVVDDNRVNLVVIKGLLKRTEAQVECVSSGQECLEKLQECSYDIILLDHLMPGMNGVETLKGIRQFGGEFEHIPVITLTANVFWGAREQYMNTGFTDYLEKPMSVAKLENMLCRYLPDEYVNIITKEKSLEKQTE